MSREIPNGLEEEEAKIGFELIVIVATLEAKPSGLFDEFPSVVCLKNESLPRDNGLNIGGNNFSIKDGNGDEESLKIPFELLNVELELIMIVAPFLLFLIIGLLKPPPFVPFDARFKTCLNIEPISLSLKI